MRCAAVGRLLTSENCRTLLSGSNRTIYHIKYPQMGVFYMAEPEGFEPSIGLTLYTLSRRAPSTARPQFRIKICLLSKNRAPFYLSAYADGRPQFRICAAFSPIKLGMTPISGRTLSGNLLWCKGGLSLLQGVWSGDLMDIVNPLPCILAFKRLWK